MPKRDTRRSLKRFIVTTAGAVTVDWVILTAIAAGVSLPAARIVFSGTNNVADTATTVLDTSMDEANDLTG